MGWKDGSVVKSMAALAEDAGSIPSTHMVVPIIYTHGVQVPLEVTGFRSSWTWSSSQL